MRAEEKGTESPEYILRIKNLKKVFRQKRGVTDLIFRRPEKNVYAVNSVSMDVRQGEILGIVGESGCGKSTLARTIIQLYGADSGEIRFENQNLLELGDARRREVCKDIQMVFQDPYASLNPKMTIRAMLTEILKVHHVCEPDNVEEELVRLIRMVGLSKGDLEKYPNEFSGGQRQRIGIARALALKPKIIIADEPVSALDVSIQAQIINLLKDLQKRLNLTVLFISHDLSVVRYIADYIHVMYLGEIVESGETEEVFNHPLHPYTKALLESIPQVGVPVDEDAAVIYGEPPSPMKLPEGCYFASRCKNCTEKCRKEHPALVQVRANHMAACYAADQQ